LFVSLAPGEVNLTAMARKNKAIKKEGGVMEGPRSSNGNAVENSKKAKDANKGEDCEVFGLVN
jgi:ribosome assembly protein YihI (activator of Der GTPase)